MTKVILYNILRFFILILLQVILLKNLTIYNLNVPLLYILFILLLPIKTPNIILFTTSFCLGLLIDVFSDTLGLHAAACTLIAFLRVLIISITVQNENKEREITPNWSTMGFRWFFLYALILTLFHHFTLFLLEAFSISNFIAILNRTAISTIFTLTLILVTEILFFRKKENG